MTYDIRYEYLSILFNPPKELLNDRKTLKKLRSKAFIISEEDIYDNILLLQMKCNL